MTSYLLAEDGSILNDEAGNRLVWDAVGGTTAITGLATVSPFGRRLALGTASISGLASIHGAGNRLALAVCAVAGHSFTSAAALALRTANVALRCISVVVAAGEPLWGKEDLATDITWTPQSPTASPWTPEAPSSTTWTKKY